MRRDRLRPRCYAKGVLRLSILIGALVAGSACGAGSVPMNPDMDSGTGESGGADAAGPYCEEHEAEHSISVEFGVCEDDACSEVDGAALKVGEYEQGSGEVLNFEMSCVVEPGSTMHLGAVRIDLQCEAAPEFPDYERYGIRAQIDPGPDQSLPLGEMQPVTLAVRSTFDGYDQWERHWALYDDAGEFVFGYEQVPSGVELDTTRICHTEPAECGCVDYRLELDFSTGDEEVVLRSSQHATLDKYDIWVGSARGFENCACGVYGGLTYLNWLMAWTP